jgi:hypothetical protein
MLHGETSALESETTDSELGLSAHTHTHMHIYECMEYGR